MAIGSDTVALWGVMISGVVDAGFEGKRLQSTFHVFLGSLLCSSIR